ncbi:tRNA uridine-5-carboxymethylaminomethyl(34) synthesis GTPase MnmE [Marivita sp. GX14005]|uniref:tRNA uridine-5-carboxymethylaminomethyl(34) synthesis GTPase MnmE n=1 Tax=Marivita sp. GX14005 TaxID=2942276 RepID=UPI002019568E|nr:tRNA uridine-5-carboxymethylaminomethyl(34) synthesis GTPase MnmE [Marivita sp. GX14005]MCL3881640.1 tRNA uridine-5-carboxymethylaminomethyl(34) synthesis GTPase MnmE [Marivita sp. GX14005]
MDTIFALATVPGKSGVAVVRVSGPDAFDLFDLFEISPPEPRRASLRRLTHRVRGFLDEALILTFEGGASFTGEPVVELHLHGSIAIAQAVLDCLEDHAEFRRAAPGEFTRRALMNDRLDLTQVEALSDLIDSETEMQRKQALSGYSGKLRDAAETWRAHLIRALSLLEATIDFADEDVPVDVTPEVSALLEKVQADLAQEIDGFGVAERIRVGFEVAIVGPPNAGKSTLLNTLAGRDAAITSEIAGTTRDVIEVRMDLGGLPVTFLDTAGLRETTDTVESIGIERAVARAREADLRIFLQGDETFAHLEPGREDIVVRGKADLGAGKDGVSGKTGQGIQALVERVQRHLLDKVTGAGLVSHQRQMDVLKDAVDHLTQAIVFLEKGSKFYDLAAEELRSTVFSLERLVGRVDIEDILDHVFASFCIGK